MCVWSRSHVHGTDSLAGVASVRNAAGHTGRMDEVMRASRTLYWAFSRSVGGSRTVLLLASCTQEEDARSAGNPVGCCYAGRAARGSRQLWLPYLGRHRKFRGSGCALPVPSAEDRNEVQQPCTRPGPFQIIEGAAGTRFDCRPSGHLFFGGWPTLPTRGIQIQYVRPLL